MRRRQPTKLSTSRGGCPSPRHHPTASTPARGARGRAPDRNRSCPACLASSGLQCHNDVLPLSLITHGTASASAWGAVLASCRARSTSASPPTPELASGVRPPVALRVGLIARAERHREDRCKVRSRIAIGPRRPSRPSSNSPAPRAMRAPVPDRFVLVRAGFGAVPARDRSREAP
jgi:hypothetical protein